MNKKIYSFSFYILSILAVITLIHLIKANTLHDSDIAESSLLDTSHTSDLNNEYNSSELISESETENTDSDINSLTESTYSETSSSETSTEDVSYNIATEDTPNTTSTEEIHSNTGNDYLLKVNRLLNCVTVYIKDRNGEYTLPYRAMACSTGKNINNTPLGTFTISDKYEWRLMIDGSYAQYATRVYKGILFHSIPYFSSNTNDMEYEEFNKLGSPASLGCIRLSAADSKWIYDNCKKGTTVIIYDDENSPGPLGKPVTIQIPLDSPYKNWDPTDPSPDNPWKNLYPTINASDLTIPLGTDINPISLVTATDTCGNDISSAVAIEGDYNKDAVGAYTVTFNVTDLLGRSSSKSITITVTE